MLLDGAWVLPHSEAPLSVHARETCPWLVLYDLAQLCAYSRFFDVVRLEFYPVSVL